MARVTNGLRLPCALGIAVSLGWGSTRARADIVPREVTVSKACQAPSKAIRAEIERLFRLAAEHATRTHLCQDGPGEITTIKLVSSCQTDASSVTVTYEVIVKHELGGECAPYPACADGGPPTRSKGSATLAFVSVDGGVQLGAPPKLPGLTLLTPLQKPHSMACNGKSPAWAPRTIPKS